MICLALLLLALVLSGCWISDTKSTNPPDRSGPKLKAGEESSLTIRIELEPAGEDRHVVVLRGLPGEHLALLKEGNWDAAQWNAFLSVYAGDAADLPAVVGEYTVHTDRVVFTPRYPLRKGLRYRAVYSPQPFHVKPTANAAPIEARFTLAKPAATSTTSVAQVYPSGDRLPENQLKFYLAFSAPMRQGEVYQYIKLFQADGTLVDLPFLELDEELWDNTGTRLTLLIDPGRIKRGLKPREDVGPALEDGKSYTLRIDAKWPDAAGNPLTRAFEKKFQVGPPDETQPDPKNWKLTAPAAETNAPLVVELPEPLDHAMLHRVLRVVDPQGKSPEGNVTVDHGERRWQFQPTVAWAAGRYELVIDTTLEDRAGNSIGRPFDLDVFEEVQQRVDTETVSLSFEVKPHS